ncbi:MAG: hypothetical protein WA485_23625 [Candidatus Sulfotelmatobacter sp.]
MKRLALWSTYSVLVVGLMIVPQANAQGLLYVLRDSAWANTGVQPTPPAAVVVTAGACNQGIGSCGGFGNGQNYLNPLTFYPSKNIQKVTITSAWGSAFTTVANVFAQGGTVPFWVPQVLSNDGLIPAGFPQNSQGDGGNANVNPATVTSIEIILYPFTFQQTAGGFWVAVGSDGNAPQMIFRVYGAT